MSFSLIRLCLSDASLLQEEEEEEEEEEVSAWDIINAANYPSACQKERKRRRKKRKEKEGKKKEGKKKVLDERSHTKKKRRVLNHHFLVGKFVCLQTRVCLVLTSTRRTAHKQRDKYTRNNTY